MTDTAAAARRGEGISTLLRPIRRRLALLNKKIDEQPKFRWAWVTSTDPLRIRLEGDSLPLEITPSVATAVPGVGAKVLTLLQYRQCTIVGTPGGQGSGSGSGIGGRGTNLIPGADSIGATGLHATGRPHGFAAFGYNRTYGTVWAQANASGNGPTIDTDIPFFIEKGVTYRFEVTAHGSVANTRFYVQVMDPDSDTSISGTRGDGVSTSYVVTNLLAGASRTTARTHTLEWTPDISSRAVLRFYCSHSNGTSNPNGYQWFSDIRFVALESQARLDTMQDDIGTVQDAIDAALARLVPAGTITAFGGETAPEGWLVCNGYPASPTAHPELFAAIGYAYGQYGSNFLLPDLRGRVPVGLNNSQSSVFDTLGNMGGAATHMLTVAELPPHNHGGRTGNTQVNRRVSGNQGSGSPVDSDSTFHGGSDFRATMSDAYTNHGHDIPSQGGGGAHNNLQPYNTVNYIIKT